jgi:hypothetical protein
MARLKIFNTEILLIGFLILVIVKPGFTYELSSVYEIKERIDYASGLVFVERWRDSYYLGIEEILTLDEYLDYQANNSIKKSWSDVQEQERKKQETEFGTQGLIPEIEIPKLPIFGEGSKINISGSDKITFGGRQTTVYGSGITQTAVSQSALPELKMKQELKVNLNGTIGDKTKILIDHDSQRQFEGKNKIGLSYTGTEDEIVQSVEMGDTKLEIPGTYYTGDLPTHSGLFGVSAKGKLGGIDLYAVASTEQSQAQTDIFSGRTQLATDTIYDYQFERKRFYVVDTLASQEVTNLLIFVDQRIANPQNYRNGLATTKPDTAGDSTSMPSGHWVKGKFILLKLGDDYYRYSRNVIELKTALDRFDVLAVSYIRGLDTIGGNKFVENQQDTYTVLKLLKPSDLRYGSPCWNYELRNIYSLGVNDVKIESLRIYREESPIDLEYEAQGKTFVSILGLDPNGDGKITWPEFDSRNGLIIFPKRFPFAFDSLSVPDSIIYQEDPLPTNYDAKYYIAIRYSSSKESFFLNKTDIEDGSEKVKVNGELWQEGTDYRINYSTGELSFLRTLPPNADIQVTFEYRPWFSTSQKSLLGTRAEWKFAENGKIGSALFYRTEGTPGDKPELGAEPFRRMITEADISYSVQSQAVSSFLDRLPLLRTEAPTSLSASSEAAISLPDPNTKGLAYLDDFEGSTVSNDISNDGVHWAFGSVPVIKDTHNFTLTPLKWLNPTTKIRKDSIFGSDIGTEGSETVDYLRVIFTPTPGNALSWAGMSNCPSQLGLDFRELENLEVILRTKHHSSGRIHLTVATNVDEDMPRRTLVGTIAGYNGIEDTEDRNRNGILDKVELEDTGLDTVAGTDGMNKLGDDGNDDYNATTNPNGTENNSYLDYEDLDRNGFNRINDYFEYSIDLSDSRFFKNLRGDWQFLRIPLLNSGIDTTVGSPSWDNIKIIRIWFDGFQSVDTIDIYSLSFVGSKWRDVRVMRDTIFYPNSATVDSTEKAVISQISVKTDPNYISPFEPKRDYTGHVEIEAALKLAYERIKPGHLVNFDKYIYDREDYRDYKTLKMYVHNDLNNPKFFLKIGTDSTNYYEYRIRISDGNQVTGRSNWYEFEIPIDTFPILKKARPSQSVYFNSEDTQYIVMGNPSLAEVRYQALGIINDGNTTLDSGAIWFNDIRLHDPRKEAGYGFNSRISLNVSDFLQNLSFGFSYSDPNFRRFREEREVKTGGFKTDLDMGGKINLDRLLPRSWNFNLPLTYHLTRSKTLPKFSAYFPDLRLNKADTSVEATLGEATTWSLDNLRKGKSNNRILNYTLEAFSYSWRRNTGNSSSPLSIDSSYIVSSNLGYGISPDLKISVLGGDLNLFPQSIQTGVVVSETRSPHRVPTHPDTLHPDSTDWKNIRTDSSHAGTFDFDANYNPIEDLGLDYSFSQDRDLKVLNSERIAGIKVGQEIGQDQNFGASYDLAIGEILSPRIDFNSEYQETRFREANEYTNLRNLNNGSDIDLSVGIELPEILSGLAKLRDERKDTSAMPGSPHWLLMKAEDLSTMVEGIDFGYTKSRNSDFFSVRSRPDWKYRFGLIDYFVYDTTQPPTINRDYTDNFNLTSGATFQDLNVRFRFDHSLSKTYYGASATSSRSTTWPDLSISVARIERFFKKWATSSNISAGYSRRSDLNGNFDPTTNTLLPTGQSKSVSNNFSPVFSWQATWKNRISTNFGFNYSKSKSENVDIQTAANNETRSGTFGISYSFSAPQGIKLPGLKKIRFSSDLSLTGSFRLSENYSDVIDPRNPEYPKPVVNRKDQDISTSLSASYRVSRSVESGLTTGYSLYKNTQRGTASRSIDLNFWVQFQF